MLTEKEIRDTYLSLHNDLSEIYYDGTMGLTKAEFDQLHGQGWQAMEDELIAGGYLTLSEPPRDLAAEIDNLKAEMLLLKKV